MLLYLDTCNKEVVLLLVVIIIHDDKVLEYRGTHYINSL